jgi:antagonist of KipI
VLKVITSGFYSSVQDFGRIGYRTYGVPVSGFMDRYSAQFANALLGNDTSAALVEMTMVGGEFQFLEPTMISISGAYMNPYLNGESILQNIAIKINAKDTIRFGNAMNGFRTYLAVKGGLQTQTVLNSQSQFITVTKTSTISKGDTLNYGHFTLESQSLNAIVKYDNSIINSTNIEVFEGPEFHKLTAQQKNELLSTEWTISKNNNRMAYQLEPLLKNDLEPILTSAVLPGTVQLTPSGNLIVLMRDSQTTGGYPRVLQLTESSINILSQKTTGKHIKIRLKD